MAYYPPSDFEIDITTRTVTHKASGGKYWWDRSPHMTTRPTPTPHHRRGHTDISHRDSHSLIQCAFEALRDAERAVERH
jgi:hypothetical protein